jgi:hypothetical protein
MVTGETSLLHSKCPEQDSETRGIMSGKKKKLNDLNNELRKLAAEAGLPHWHVGLEIVIEGQEQDRLRQDRQTCRPRANCVRLRPDRCTQEGHAAEAMTGFLPDRCPCGLGIRYCSAT